MSGPASQNGAELERRIRVVVVDDHALFREGIASAIGARVEIVGEADDVQSGVDVTVAHRPDVVLLDVNLPSGSGAEVIPMVAAALPDGPIIQFLGLSVSDAPEDVLGLVRAGARGYVTKRIDGPELVDAIEQVAGGNAVFSPRLAGFVLDAFGRDGTTSEIRPKGTSESAEFDLLTPREREVMQFLARGYTYKEIGAELHISARTVESHTGAVLRKLQLSNRHEVTHWVARNGLM